MMETLYGNGLVLLGLWVSTSLVMLFIWGVLAWAVLKFFRGRESDGDGREPPTTETPTTCARPSTMTRGVALDPVMRKG